VALKTIGASCEEYGPGIRKLQASSLTMTEGYNRMIAISSFGAFPEDKFAKAPQQIKEKYEHKRNKKR